jgi:hypothetical protein
MERREDRATDVGAQSPLKSPSDSSRNLKASFMMSRSLYMNMDRCFASLKVVLVLIFSMRSGRGMLGSTLSQKLGSSMSSFESS